MLECGPKMKPMYDNILEKADGTKSMKKKYDSKSVLELVEELEAEMDSLEAEMKFSWHGENEKTTTKEQAKFRLSDLHMHGECKGEPTTRNVDGSYSYMGVCPLGVTLPMNIYSTGPPTIGGSRALPLD